MSGRDTDAPSTAAEAGVVGDPYNDIVARAVPSSRRSRLLAVRFFGSGILALIVAFAAHEILNRLEFQPGYAAILLLGAVGLAISATFFVPAREPLAPLPPEPSPSFLEPSLATA